MIDLIDFIEIYSDILVELQQTEHCSRQNTAIYWKKSHIILIYDVGYLVIELSFSIVMDNKGWHNMVGNSHNTQNDPFGNMERKKFHSSGILISMS